MRARTLFAKCRVLSTFALCTAAAVTGAGCPPVLTGAAAPALDEAPVSTPLLCREQHPAGGTAVTVAGSAFAPIVFDIPTDPTLALPALALLGAADLFGGDAEIGDVIFGGAPGEPNAELLSWQSAAQLTFLVNDAVALGDGGTGAIGAGLYDLRVTNADGQQAGAARAFGVTEAPTITGIDPPFTCLEQGARTLVLTGTGALRVGENLPVVDAGGVQLTPALDDCRALAHPALDAELCGEATVELAEDALAPGAHPVTLTNPAPAACTTSAPAEIVVVAAPVIDAVVPAEVCTTPGDVDLIVSGSGFLRMDGVDLAVTVDGAAATPFDFTGCAPIAVTGASVESCAGFTVTVDAAAYAAGSVEVAVLNPAPGDCGATAYVVAVPPPVVNAVVPPAVCDAASTLDLTVSGSGFARLDGVDFTVTVGGAAVLPSSITDCTPVATADGRSLELCETFVISVDAGAQAGVDVEILVDNPSDGCTGAANWLVTPPPVINAVVPDALCSVTGGVDLQVSGAGFLRVNGVDFAVTIDGSPIAPQNVVCSPLNATGATVESCTDFIITVDPGAFALGSVDVVVENLIPGACTATASAIVAPLPTIATIEPPTACQEPGLVDLTVTGTGFAVINGAPFAVDVGGTPVTPTQLACAPVSVSSGSLELCTSFVVSVDPSAFAATDVDVTVTNDADGGLGGACAATADWLVFPAPIIAAAEPNGVCQALATPLDVTVSGSGFLRIDGTDFTVRVNGAAATPSNLVCAPLALAGVTAESCTSFVVTIDPTGLPVGGVEIAVTNPDPATCTDVAPDAFRVFSPPTVTAIVPDEVCADVLTAFDIQGTDLNAGTLVDVSGEIPDSIIANADGSLTVTFNTGLTAGTYDVTVDNGGCTFTAAGALLVNPTPLVFFVDPPVVFNGIQTEATIFAAGVDEDVTLVEIIDGAGAVTSLAFSSPDRPQRIVATVPAGLAPGVYAVRVTSADGCRSALDGRMTITEQLDIDLVSVDPIFVSPTVPTAVTVNAGAAGAPFVNLPRVYLSSSSGAQGNAVALRAVELFSATQLSAVVAGVPPDLYDLIVVNPTGEVGFLPGAVTVTVLEPPVITAMAPGAFDAGFVANDVEIEGTNFQTGIGITFECVDFATGATVTAPPAAAVTSEAIDKLVVNIDGTSTPQGAVCIVIATNPDLATFRFSAISFRNPAQNLNPFLPGSAMTEARRGLVLAAGRPTETSRFLYAVGGDAGAVGSAKATVEAVPVDALGAMGTWASQRNSLANAFDGATTTALPRTLAGGARIGRFVYVVGGNDGAGATNTLLRAQILDPLAGPEIDDVDATLGDGVVGLGEGLYIYRISALFPTTDTSNPGGESLAGDAFSIDVPAVAELLVFTLRWDAVTGASGYRVYRTPNAGDTADAVELLAELAGSGNTSFTDDDTAVFDPDATPLPSGSLGVWHAVSGSALGTPRAAHATVNVRKPGTRDTFFLYAVGGLTTGGAPVATGEVATVTIAGDGSQTVSAWTPLTASLPSARSELTGLVIAPSDTPRTGGATLVYFVAGRPAAGQLIDDVEAAAIDPDDGDITAYTTINDPPNTDNAPSPARVGAAGISANGFMYVFGGSNGAASNNDTSAELSTTPPLVEQWDALGGGSMLQARVSLAAAIESAFFFVGGGRNAAGPIATIDRTIQ